MGHQFHFYAFRNATFWNSWICLVLGLHLHSPLQPIRPLDHSPPSILFFRSRGLLATFFYIPRFLLACFLKYFYLAGIVWTCCQSLDEFLPWSTFIGIVLNLDIQHHGEAGIWNYYVTQERIGIRIFVAELRWVAAMCGIVLYTITFLDISSLDLRLNKIWKKLRLSRLKGKKNENTYLNYCSAPQIFRPDRHRTWLSVF